MELLTMFISLGDVSAPHGAFFKHFFINHEKSILFNFILSAFINLELPLLQKTSLY